MSAQQVPSGPREIERAVKGALRSTVEAHGVIVAGSWIGSATKRIVGVCSDLADENQRLRNCLTEIVHNPLSDDFARSVAKAVLDG